MAQAEQAIPAAVDWLIHGGGLCACVGAAWAAIGLSRKVTKRLDRDESLRQDYPPHRHVNGTVIYPKEYEPAGTQRLNGTQTT